jgi:hypothetical protein
MALSAPAAFDIPELATETQREKNREEEEEEEEEDYHRLHGFQDYTDSEKE